MTDRPREFVVRRSKWLRGLSSRETWLLDDAGRMCCLGFVAEQCGVATSALLHVDAPVCVTPSESRKLEPALLKSCGDGDSRHTALTCDAIGINDDPSLSDPRREAKLAALFAKHGYRLRFEP